MSEEYKQGMEYERTLSIKALYEVLFRLQDIGHDIVIGEYIEYFDTVLTMLEASKK